ncbi:MAG: GNAT family N-acetyltransferase [Burkholderiales bacterium]
MIPSFLLARPEHRSVLAEMMEEFYQFHHLVFSKQVNVALNNLLAHPEFGIAWIVYLQELPIGYGVVTFSFSLELGGEIAGVDELYIRSFYQGKGIGLAALQFMEAFCRSQGKQTLILEAIGAIDFYHKQGFHDRSSVLMFKHLGKIAQNN